jgi:hypothetical protein
LLQGPPLPFELAIVARERNSLFVVVFDSLVKLRPVCLETAFYILFKPWKSKSHNLQALGHSGNRNNVCVTRNVRVIAILKTAWEVRISAVARAKDGQELGRWQTLLAKEYLSLDAGK